MPNAIESPRNVCNKTKSLSGGSCALPSGMLRSFGTCCDIKNSGAYEPNDAIDEHMINIRTVDDLNGEKSINGGFGVRICVFFSFTFKYRKKNKLEEKRKEKKRIKRWKWNRLLVVIYRKYKYSAKKPFYIFF